jgi:hypothetical protein
LLPDDPNVRNPATLPFDIAQKLGRYGREAPLQSIVNFLMIYIRNPNKISIFSSSTDTINSIRAKMQPRIAAALVPENSNRWGFKKGGRRRKTKKSKRRARKTRRRHK